tara:strand:+ start:85021 stop:86010 length:990 start_codon:yes stop_codon:yes gene_type:complete
MNYIGSKKKLLTFIESTINDNVPNISDKTFCDLFAGTGIVGNHFKDKVNKVISNDLEYYSYVLNRNYIGNSNEIEDKEDYIKSLNNLPLITDGFIYQNYCRGESDRQYFSDNNGQKIDTIRQGIENLKTGISDDLYYFLLASLLESADKVANTASVYGAYLKDLKKTAQKDLILSSASFKLTDNPNDTYNLDSNELISKIDGDILYLDPPYNARQYGSNYHILNTIALYNEFIPKGVTGLPEYNRSKYCSKVSVIEEFESLIQNARFKYIFLSYNNEGLMSVKDVESIMSNYGTYKLVKKDYQRFKADKDKNRKFKAKKTEEYLHILIK